MNNKQTKNGVNTLSPQDKQKEKKLEKEYWELFALLNPEQVEQAKQADERLEPSTQSRKYYPVKNFLLEKSLLVQFETKENSGKELTKAEQARERRIYDLWDEVFTNIQKELAKYYQTVTNGNYRFAGMPKIRKGICGWAEDKIWRLLVSLGEPNHFCDLDKTNDFWAEAE
jgi:hypothetical protein